MARGCVSGAYIKAVLSGLRSAMRCFRSVKRNGSGWLPGWTGNDFRLPLDRIGRSKSRVKKAVKKAHKPSQYNALSG